MKQIKFCNIKCTKKLYTRDVDLKEKISAITVREIMRAKRRLRGCASEVLGKPQKKHQDWFDDSDPEIRKLINDFRTSLRTPDDNKRRAAHYNLKVKSDILSRWAEHFNDVLNPDHQTTDIPYIEALEDLPVEEQLADAPSYSEFISALAKLKNDKTTYINLQNASYRRFGLAISITKTQVLKQPLRGLNADDSSIEINNKHLQNVSKFKYLGSQIRSDNSLTSEIAARIASAASAFGKLNDRVWKSHDLKLQTKIAVYKALVLSTLLYASETWCCYKADIKKLDKFHLRCLRSILRIKWEDRVPNTEILRRVKLAGIEALIIKHQLRWSGHIVRMDDSRLPKAVFYSQLSCGKRRKGGQHLRYKDTIKRHLTACGIPSNRWEELALRRSEWRSTVHKSIEQFEQKRVMDLDAKRELRKSQLKPVYTYTYNSAGQLHCAPCNRIFKAKFGFASHIRAYHNKDRED
ncbi:uncharacterized protein LOC126092712 [Schistocerca cancellata]|uniref:uncharacterized protein LOC126092712 n=1 Tax=Schistocerca cancellata TaxID=274614 RepID=UPI0021185FE3|nr:uncharacterized protein LOC126092712 [Schistocerca cancellata]